MAGVGLGRCVALLPGWDPRGVHILGVGVLVPGGGGRLLLIKGHQACFPFPKMLS